MKKHGLVFLAILALSLTTAFPIWADTDFTVQNESNDKLEVDVYNGDDSVCWVPLKTVTVDANETKKTSCDGGGKHRCKVVVRDVEYSNDDYACSFDTADTALCYATDIIKVPSHATLVVESDTDYCTVEDSDSSSAE